MMKRYDPIEYSDMGGWSWDVNNIKECEDGDYVKFEDVEPFIEFFRLHLEMVELLKKATFEDNVHEDTAKYLECSDKHKKLAEQLKERL